MTNEEYNSILENIIVMITEDFPDPNPLGSLFSTYIGDSIIYAIERMKK